ncbi:MAG: hypothetical protein AB200_01730 [Parcubacteria bacterium C7867-005]|nr:MAG: hypothetical protein AB200_01730 [Parcubacteria bacterium C7867-005]
MKKKVLIVTPRSPFQARGADELERLSGIRWFIKYGFDVRVITKTVNSDLPHIEIAEKELGIPIIPVSYKYTKTRSPLSLFKRLFNPLYWDGAAFEYFDKETQDILQRELDVWKPDLVWFDFTYLWPLHSLVKKMGIPVVTRSLNYEPRHFIEEEGVSALNILLYVPKFMTECFAARSSDLMIALNPNEERKYKKLGAKKAVTLPLQALPDLIRPHTTRDLSPLHILFMGSSYSVGHNKVALDFIVKEIAPAVFKSAPDEFAFHVTGSKFPSEYEVFIDGKNIIYDGYVPKEKMNEYFDSIDCMISPSAKRVGMQGKVFEPLARNIPLITSPDNVVGYPFKHKQSVLLAENKDEYVNMLLYVRSKVVRESLSKESSNLCASLFSRERIDGIMQGILGEFSLNK